MPAGEDISFHLTADAPGRCRIEIYRLGAYGGTGGRLVTSSPELRVGPQPVDRVDDLLASPMCRWSAAWTLSVPPSWTSGVYVAVFVGRTHRGVTPFVVRDDRPAQLCVVLPTATYQAYNFWPHDRRRGRNLYWGRDAGGAFSAVGRATSVSFDRPYSGEGFPFLFEGDAEFVRWVESEGYDVTYATSEDLHRGRIDVRCFRGLVFPGHDEYWTEEMRNAATDAAAAGTSLVFLSANNLYWVIRLRAEQGSGAPDRVVYCAKAREDPQRGAGLATTKWRSGRPGPVCPEQQLLGVQYRSTVKGHYPLVVRNADHWVWRGAGVAEGAAVPRVVTGEADNVFPRVDPKFPGRRTLLSRSPYVAGNGRDSFDQETSVQELANGALIFAAGTFGWTVALRRQGAGCVARATANVLDRVCAGPVE